MRKPEPNETVDSWDVTGFITPENLNSLELMVKNNENNRSTNTDLIYAVVNFSTGPAPTLQSITVSPAVASIEEVQTQQFSATGHYSDSSTQNLTNTATWSSSNPAVATINAAGLAGGVTAGASNISATQDSVVSNTAGLEVTAQSSDVVTIDEAVCVEERSELFVAATSTDATATLTVVGFGVMENLEEGEYEFVVTGVSSCPPAVTVASNKGGSAIANVELD